MRVDKIGNVIGVKSGVRSEPGQAPLKVMLAAHMDEIGLMVKHLIRFLIQLAEEQGIKTQINLGGGTEDGVENVTADAPLELDEVEALMREPGMLDRFPALV
jgi:putative aminopeptidase FrvX